MKHQPTPSTYPNEIAASIRTRWVEQGHADPMLPVDPILVSLVDVVYQASLMREEGEAVRSRVVFAEPAVFADSTNDGNHAIQTLRFASPQAYSPHNLRKLAAAAGFYRSMLAVEICEQGNLQIWGMVVTGTQWVNDVRGSQSHGAPLLADLMSVGGSLVLDRSFRLIGFGAEILGATHVQRIHRALDLEADRSIQEPADTTGTRHRSAYRLVNGIDDAIAVVVSQDGDVRFVANHQGKLAYWPYLP